MTNYSISEIKRILRSQNINFVAYAITPWHLIGAKAVYAYLESKGIKLRPVFIVDAHKDGGYFIQDDDEVTLYHRRIEGGFSYRSFIRFLLLCLLRNQGEKADMYIVNAWLPDFKRVFQTIPSLDTRFQIYLYEEGASCYRPEFKRLSYFWGRLNALQLVNKAVNLWMSKVYERRGLVHEFFPFKSDGGKLRIDNDVVNFYKKVEHIKEILLNPKRIVIAMQSIQMEEIDIVRNVSRILEGNGYEVIIKEHPRYPLDGYGLDKYRVDSKGKGLEAFVPEIAPAYIIGFWSTTLLTMNYFYGIKPVSLYFLLDRAKMDAEELHACSWFYDTFKDIVAYPKTIDDLKVVLS